MIEEQSAEASFIDFKQAYKTNPYVKGNCHQIAHVIGRAAAKKYLTLADTYARGDNFCWSGYYHGAVETIANVIGPAKILSQVNTVCASFLEPTPYSFDHYNCVHGMGHGLMAVQDDELFTALKTCDKFDGDWQQQSCYGGVFMENIMNDTNPGEHSNYLKADDPLYPCTAVEDRQKDPCYMMQTSHVLTVKQNDYSKVFEICAAVAAPFDAACFQSLGRDISGQSSSDQQATLTGCQLGPTDAAQEYCFAGAVRDFISYFYDDAPGLALCKAIANQTISTNCTTIAQEYYATF